MSGDAQHRFLHLRSGLLPHVRRAACGSVQLELRLLPHLHAHSISYFARTYDAIRTIIQPNKTTDAPTDGHGRDSHSTAVLQALPFTFILRTVKTTNGRLPDDGTFPMPQRRRPSIRGIYLRAMAIQRRRRLQQRRGRLRLVLRRVRPDVPPDDALRHEQSGTSYLCVRRVALGGPDGGAGAFWNCCCWR